MLTAYPSPETSKGWGGLGGGWKVQKWMVEVDRPCNLGFFEEPFRNYDEKNPSNNMSLFFGDMVIVDVWNRSMAEYMHQSLKMKTKL